METQRKEVCMPKRFTSCANGTPLIISEHIIDIPLSGFTETITREWIEQRYRMKTRKTRKKTTSMTHALILVIRPLPVETRSSQKLRVSESSLQLISIRFLWSTFTDEAFEGQSCSWWSFNHCGAKGMLCVGLTDNRRDTNMLLKMKGSRQKPQMMFPLISGSAHENIPSPNRYWVKSRTWGGA